MKVLITGDFYPGGRLGCLAEIESHFVLGDFLKTIQSADLSILNLEAPLCIEGQGISKSGPNIRANPVTADFIKHAGFGLVTLANNHIFDFGTPALKKTFKELKARGTDFVGAGKTADEACLPHVLRKRNESLAVLNFAENEWSTTLGSAPGSAPIDPVRNYRAIRSAKKEADKVLVICHGGHEMYSLPSPRMKELFRFYVEAGADAVINHHTHCVSGYEVYNGAPVFYSLGNFLFDQPTLREGAWTEGIAVELEFKQSGVDFEIHHFNQCTADTLFAVCDKQEQGRRTARIQALNAVIADDGALARKFMEFVDSKTRQYRRYLEPTTIRLIEAAQCRGWLPSLLTRKQRRLMLNLIRCESHREIVIELLERDVGNPR